MDHLNRSALHYVSINYPESHQLAEIELLLKAGLDLNAQDINGWTPLHVAAQHWSLPAVRALIKAGASANAKDRHGNSPLSNSVFSSRGRGDVIRELLAAGADPYLENNQGVSPKRQAASLANYDVVQFFD